MMALVGEAFVKSMIEKVKRSAVMW